MNELALLLRPMAGQGLFGPHLEITFESHLAPPYGGRLNAGQRGVRGATGELMCLRLKTKTAAMATPVQVVTTAA